MIMEEIKDKNGLTEKEFLKQYCPEDYDRPSIAADVVLFAIDDVKNPKLKVFLTQRETHPYMGSFALPGCFIGMEESIDMAAERKIKEVTGIDDIYMEQLYTFGDPKRDPRMRVVTSVYIGMVNEREISKMKSLDNWFDVEIREKNGTREMVLTGPEGINMSYDITERNIKNGVTGSAVLETCLKEDSTKMIAFDHARIISMAISRIAGKCEYVPILFNLMPETFTIPELQSVYELFLAKRPHNTLFRKKVSEFIADTGMMSKSTNRPAKLYSFVHKN